MKFYLTYFELIKPKKNHVCIPLDYNFDRSKYFSTLINLNYNELKYISIIESNFQDLEPTKDFEIPIWDFLKTKHTFEEKKLPDGEPLGINSFELNEYDLMYMKLMDWIE